MIVNGINIYPIEIEQALRDIPGVVDVVAMPISDKVSQDIPVAVISLDAKTKIDAIEIQEIALARLGFRAPRKVFVLREIPRNSNGKVQRKELMALLKQSIQVEQ
jgi:acyl-CoA synthetase (AMP-forming)/AMP-acid ligase II